MSRGKEPRRGLGPPLPDRLKEPKQRSSRMPEWVADWVEDYFSILVLGGCILAFGMFSLWQLSRQEPAKPIDPKTRCRVVVLGPARKIYEEGSATKVETVVVAIRNMGPAEAVGMSVNVNILGTPLRLDGPGMLRPGETYEFKARVGRHMASGDAIEVSAGCGNCF